MEIGGEHGRLRLIAVEPKVKDIAITTLWAIFILPKNIQGALIVSRIVSFSAETAKNSLVGMAREA